MRKAQLAVVVWLALVRQLAMLAAVIALRHQVGQVAFVVIAAWLALVVAVLLTGRLVAAVVLV